MKNRKLFNTMSDRYLTEEDLPLVRDENMNVQANMGFFGFNLSGLYEYCERKETTAILIEDLRIIKENEKEDLDEPIIVLEVNPDYLKKGGAFTFESENNFHIASGNKRLEAMVVQGKEVAEVYLLSMEEILPYLVHGQKEFVDYWNEKLDSFCQRRVWEKEDRLK